MNSQIIDLANPLWFQTLKKLRYDVYQLPEYLKLESVRTKTTPEAYLIVDGEKICFVPYLLRKCEDILDAKSTAEKIFDVVSPFGYSGILLNEAAAKTPEFLELALQELKNELKAKGVCSAFFRLHPLLNQNFNEVCNPEEISIDGETVSVDLKLSESQIWAWTRKGHQSTINKCKRLGYVAKVVPFEDYINKFINIYEQTMERVAANESAYFTHNYFNQLLSLGDKLHLCIVELNEEISCACLFFECCGIVQAHLGGTKTEFLSQSPFNLLLDYVRFWAKKRGNEFLHLGGGIGGSNSDSLYKFKAGFSRQRHNFLTLRLIIDEPKYQRLVELRAKYLNISTEELLKSKFFPSYRFCY